MNMRKASFLLAGVSIILSILACGTSVTAPTVSNIRMTTDNTGKTPTSTYAPGDKFFVFADLGGLKTGSVVEAKWYAVSAQGVVSNSDLNTSDYTFQPGVSFVYFQLSTTDGSDWPVGSYKVEIYLDGTKVGEQGFAVQ
jgi:hypothetical protein